jgi:hypothetical protein
MRRFHRPSCRFSPAFLAATTDLDPKIVGQFSASHQSGEIRRFAKLQDGFWMVGATTSPPTIRDPSLCRCGETIEAASMGVLIRFTHRPPVAGWETAADRGILANGQQQR